MEELFAQIKEEVAKRLGIESSGHDIHHAERVFNLAMHLQEKEGGDAVVVGASALLHDTHRMIEKETGKFCPPADSLPTVKEILELVNFPVEKIPHVLKCIEHHEEYDFGKEEKYAGSLEGYLVQDADNLDAIGAVGIGRCFAYGGAHGILMYTSEKELEAYGDYIESKHAYSSLHHFYDKLFKLKDDMNTPTAKAMAEDRHNYMKGFVERFLKENKGEL